MAGGIETSPNHNAVVVKSGVWAGGIETSPNHNAVVVMDGAAARLQAVVPRGWLVVGVAALTPAFVDGPRSPCPPRHRAPANLCSERKDSPFGTRRKAPPY